MNALDQETAKLIGALACNMPSLTAREIAEWNHNPVGLRKFLTGLKSELQLPKEAKPGEVWKTITLGIGFKTSSEFAAACEYACDEMVIHCDNLMDQRGFTVSPSRRQVDLTIYSVAELGFESGADLNEIYKKAIERGLELCPAEVGPQLRLRYINQPVGEWLRIAMKAIDDSDRRLRIFTLMRDGEKRKLIASRGEGGCSFRSQDRFVFVKPRKAA